MARKTQSPNTITSAQAMPAHPTVASLRDSAQGCKACDLWLRGTQTVFGEGAAHAKVMFVGEQPGDNEDLEGKPFVGPAGALLDKALVDAGIDRNQTYVTNAVKHFKWEPRGKRRIHKKPNSLEIRACRPWLEAEINVVKPHVIVCLGATAAQSLLGPGFRVTQQRGACRRSVQGCKSLQPFIRRPSCVRPTTPLGTEKCSCLSKTCRWWQDS